MFVDPVHRSRGAMPLSRPPIRASYVRPRLHAILVLDQIRQGRRLLAQLETQDWHTAEDEYHAWHDYNQRLMRLLLSREEVLEVYLRTTYRPMLVPGSAVLDGLNAEIRELESVAERLGQAPL